MNTSQRISRRQFIASGGMVAAAAALAGCGSSRPRVTVTPAGDVSKAAVSPPTHVAYCTLFIAGKWKGPLAANGQPSLAIVDEILTPRAGYATPHYLLTSNGGDTGDKPVRLSSEEVEVNSRFTRAGVDVGIRIEAFDPNKSAADAPSVESLVEQSHQIRTASDAHGGIYDWLFLDHAWERTPKGRNGLDDLQAIIDGLASAGWSKVMINATNFNTRDLPYLPQRTWSMARHFDVMGKNYRQTVADVVAHGSGAVTSNDLQFVDYVRSHRPGSTPLLKLEIPSETQRFRVLSVADQMTLLRLWAQASAREHFTLTYPLYVSGADPSGSQAHQYDSYTVGTFWEQRSLMEHYG